MQNRNAPRRVSPAPQGPPTVIPANSSDGPHPRVPGATEEFGGRLVASSFQNPAAPRRARSFAERHGG